jgi:hypothetical protein
MSRHGGMGQVAAISTLAIATKTSYDAMILNMYDPTTYPDSPRSVTRPQRGQVSTIRNQLRNSGASPQFGQRRRIDRQRSCQAVGAITRWCYASARIERAITIRWISLVPSPIVQSLTSR